MSIILINPGGRDRGSGAHFGEEPAHVSKPGPGVRFVHETRNPGLDLMLAVIVEGSNETSRRLDKLEGSSTISPCQCGAHIVQGILQRLALFVPLPLGKTQA